MDSQHPASRSFARILASFLRSASDEDLLALERNEARIVVQRLTAPQVKREIASVDSALIVTRLTAAETREDGLAILSELAPIKAQLLAVAASLDLTVPKTDTIERLRDRLVEATIGFKLRSEAIRETNT